MTRRSNRHPGPLFPDKKTRSKLSWLIEAALHTGFVCMGEILKHDDLHLLGK